MTNVVPKKYKMPQQIEALMTYLATIDDSKWLQMIQVPAANGESWVIVASKT